MSTNYPSADDLQAFAMNAGIIAANVDLTLDYARVIAAAIKQWQSDTAWSPFVATTQTRYYDLPQGKFMDLRGGLLSLTTLSIGPYSAPYVLTLGIDFDLYPLNAANDGLPYEWVEFRRKHEFAYNRHGAVSLTGSFGRVTIMPPEVTHAILCNAAVRLAPTKANGAMGMATRIKQDEIELQYGPTTVTSPNAQTPQQMQLLDQYNVTMQDYRRLRLV